MNRFAGLLLVIFASLMTANILEAQKRGGGGGGAINKLSGPGPFEAYGVHFIFDSGTVPLLRALPGTFERDTGRDLDGVPVWVGLEIYRAVGTGNDLEYSADVDESKQVNFWTLEPTIDWTLWSSHVELGVGFGFHWFTGDAFDTFFKASIGPRIGWRFASGDWGSLRLQSQVLLALGGFDAEDFGAIPGTFDSSLGEIPFVVRLTYDFSY